jgi:3-oxo-5-alpha-steroid 4-dehydrogenase 3
MRFEEYVVLLFCAVSVLVIIIFKLGALFGIQLVDEFMTYGRHRVELKTKCTNSSSNGPLIYNIIDFIRHWTVPKSWFTHFYIYAFWLNIGTWAYAVLLRQYQPSLIMWILVESHLVRRLEECLNISKFSSGARMHVFHYVFGLGFYTCVCLATCCSSSNSNNNSTECQSYYIFWIKVALFVIVSIQQRKCHRILAELRSDRSERYYLPSKGWFLYVSCPHYLF